jgi:integrase
MARTPATGIYLRGSVYWLNFQRNGKRLFVSLETSEFAEAIKRGQEIRVNPQISNADSFSLEIDAFLAYKRRKNQFTVSSAHGRRYILLAFARHILKLSPANVTPKDVKDYYETMLDAHGATTANSYAMILRSFFNWCVGVRRIIRLNPTSQLELARTYGTKAQRFCTCLEREKLINECRRDDLRFVLFCGFHAGLRKNEIIEARPFWFDLDGGLLHLRKTTTMHFKDREERTVPLTSSFIEFLRSYGLREPFMLAPKVVHGKNRYRYDFSRPFREHVTEQGLPWVTPHTMRRTFASLLASAGVSLYKISRWLGDDPRVVDRRYANLIPNDPDIERAHTSHSSSKASIADCGTR